MRERALNVEPQSAITKDNVHVHVSGNLYFQFVDAEKAAYGAKNPLYAVKQHAQSSMRAAIGELELDQILHDRVHLNNAIRSTVQEAAYNWGIDIKRYEITEVMPDQHIIDAMDKQAAAERERRKKVLEAEGAKRKLELESEGRRIQLQNESEGELIRAKNLAQARKEQYRLEAEGEAYAINQRAIAHAEAIAKVSSALRDDQSNVAAQLNIAREYITMYGDIGQKSNTMFFSDKPADVNALMAQAATIFKATPSLHQQINNSTNLNLQESEAVVDQDANNNGNDEAKDNKN
jgi:regulator of protease activity HflC (stomatin/prohibitin superfamily)